MHAWKGARLTKNSTELQQESGMEDEIIERRVLFVYNTCSKSVPAQN